MVQTGKSGMNLGKIEINLDSLGKGAGRPTSSSLLIPASTDTPSRVSRLCSTAILREWTR